MSHRPDSITPAAVRHGGFTLIELLVVISIIALLIAILLPALGKARLAARMTQGSSQLRQIQLGVLNYAYQSKGHLPYAHNSYDISPGIAWSGLLHTLGHTPEPRLYWGPLRESSWYMGDLAAMTTNRHHSKWNYVGVSINTSIAPIASTTKPATWPVNVDQGDLQPTRILTLFEGHRKDLRPDGSGVMRDGWYGGSRGGGQMGMLTYEQSAVATYLDGHAQTRQAEDLGWIVLTQTWSTLGSATNEPWFYNAFLKPR